MANLTFVSIVMTYFERFDQLKNTLKSFQIQRYSNFEVIIVDDGSVKEPISNNMFNEYEFSIHVINMPHIKNHTNPCVPFNIGFSKTKGPIVIFQNSECLHLGNILSHARSNLTDNNYFSYAAYSLSNKRTKKLINNPHWNLDYLQELLITESNSTYGRGDEWCNHSIFRPLGLHFTSAITKSNLNKLGGFDTRYGQGSSFDDNEILIRIGRMGLVTSIVDNEVVIHQWHGIEKNISRWRRYSLRARNHLLYLFVTKTENQYEPNKNSVQYLLYKSFRPILVILYVILTLGMAALKKSVALFTNKSSRG